MGLPTIYVGCDIAISGAPRIRIRLGKPLGIGIDWYGRLEQYRSVSPSVTIIDAPAHALRLSAAEHAHLRTLVLVRRSDRFVQEDVPPSLTRLINGLRQPAYITGRRWGLLA